ncbi:hypothetical protein CQA40_05980 [Helicobacter sp. MIT 01-3238]|nr:hypothetical protein CQA40_05980 [Helicobacter sp. MIT 01-3238]
MLKKLESAKYLLPNNNLTPNLCNQPFKIFINQLPKINFTQLFFGIIWNIFCFYPQADKHKHKITQNTPNKA